MKVNQDVLLAVRVTRSEKEAFETLAEAREMRVSDLLRQLAQKEIRKSRREKSPVPEVGPSPRGQASG
jgi:hypothetical protein